MASLDFPASPLDGDLYSANGKTFRYSSALSSWVNQTGVGFTGSRGFTGSSAEVQTKLIVTSRAGTTVEVPVANGVLSITNRAGSTISVTVN